MKKISNNPRVCQQGGKMFRKVFQTLHVLTIGAYVMASEALVERRERKAVEKFTARMLADIGDTELLSRIVRHHPDADIVAAAIRRLRALGEEEVLLSIALTSEHITHRVLAAEQLTEPRSFELLLVSQAVTVRAAGARTCTDIPVLKRYLVDKDDRVRDFAEVSLIELGYVPNAPTTPVLG